MKTNLILILLLVFSLQSFAKGPADLVKYVNTLQGTNSNFELTRGNTYPTTALPFAMHTWTPQTGVNGDGWKYQYQKDSIRGFQQAHQCSSWTNDYCVFSLMPVSGELALDQFKRAAAFSHDNEIAKPNYYKVELDNRITAEMSPTERGVHLRFSYPKKGGSYLVLDGYTGMSQVRIEPEKNRVVGYVHNGRGLTDNFKNYFVIQFDTPIREFGTWENQNTNKWAGETQREGKGVGAWFRFDDGVKVQAKVASSYISPEQAHLNLERELGNFKTLEETKNAAGEIWNKHLNRILVEGGTEAEKATFYSCYFRASLFSRAFFELDKDGKPYYFSPYDGQIHSGYIYTDTGFWDTFRAQFPLNALMYPTMHGRYVAGLLDAYDQCGWLPSWSFPGEAGSMIGNHAISLFADAWAKGIHTFDPKKALQAYFHEATNKGPWGPANGRHGWKEYYTLGYVPYPKYREATAKTLEYAYDDFCGTALAQMTGNTFYANIFSRQILNYKNVFDPSVGFMCGRDESGDWKANFDPYEWGGPFTEGNAWHYLWSVFHDVMGLVDLLGGNEQFVTKLDSVFSVPNTVNVGTYGGKIHEMTEMQMAEMGQYAHGNQPIQHMVYLYNYAGQPWKAQKWVRTVMSKLYNATENGYPGDEDQGQTSSWYVLSAMGFYSVCPGTTEYVLGSPVFEKVTITLEDGKKFVIRAENNNPENVYIQSAKLNGEVYSKNFIYFSDIVAGGELKLQMGKSPNLNRGTKESDFPYSFSND
ncbi:GH92 family glycosyl hydrolase [uncultured Draconibacterium sp.]|uniref:GH92 family glycosyl hydrolase n=1 Tax=uncultured Draconibacterium sp. TaxID=1573823 RepID=UPI003216C4D2